MADPPRADVAVIGGTGFYSFIVDATDTWWRCRTTTRRGRLRSARWPVGGWHSCRGTAHHDHPPHAIAYRAQAWALRSIGVRQVLAPCAVGSPQGIEVRDDIANSAGLASSVARHMRDVPSSSVR